MSLDSQAAFFHLEDEVYVGNGPARGPWSAEACHAGPVTAVIARTLEPIAPAQQLVRLSISFVRPVPVAGFRVTTELVRAGRAATTATARLTDLGGKLCAKAKSLHLATYEPVDFPCAPSGGPEFTAATAAEWPFPVASHGLPFFASGIEIKLPPGEDNGPGPTTMWMRTIGIIEGEEPSPFQALCPLADCGNGISRNTDIRENTCVNPDLTLVVFRQPESEWLASAARSFWEPNGIGMSHAMLYDTKGVVGTALQTLIIRPVG